MDRDDARLCLRPDAMVPGHRLELLRDGREAYPRMLAAIRRAEKFVLLETYTFAEDATGRLFAKTLQERAAAGVDVRVLYDAVGSRSASREFFGWMRTHGIHVVEFHPLSRFFRGLRHRRRDHRKLLVVDGRTAFVGGLNISREYAPLREGGQGWRDTQVEIEGPAVAALTEMFHELWRLERRGRRLAPPQFEPPGARGEGAHVRVLSSHKFRKRWVISRHYRYALHNARERIWIANAYFLPSASFRRVLRKAARRGVDVRLIVPFRSDVPPALYATQRLFTRLLKWGIRIYSWYGPMMHAKTAVVDGRWSTVGSYNIDHLSLRNNYELTAIAVGGEFGRQMEGMFRKDFENCREITREEWKRRGWIRRLLEDFFYTFRTLF